MEIHGENYKKISMIIRKMNALSFRLFDNSKKKQKKRIFVSRSTSVVLFSELILIVDRW